MSALREQSASSDGMRTGDDLGGFQQHFDFEQVCHIVELALSSVLTLHEI